ncbi:NUDIX hydrolase domain-like protein [Sporodiniella umbellata]|nr:NUDIX hydrolase domain-like protein [Sporodiniella umbellata]
MITSQKQVTLILTIDRKEKKVLLGMKKRGFGAGKYNGFGGKVEPGETIEEGARRELTEEAEITAIDMTKMAVVLFTFENNPVGLEMHLFVTEAFEGEPKETEEMKPDWFDYKDIPFDRMWADDKQWFPLILEKQQPFVGYFHFSEDQASILKQRIVHMNDQRELTEDDLKHVYY